jgi:cytochrome c oxidase cbb3-type subunit III
MMKMPLPLVVFLTMSLAATMAIAVAQEDDVDSVSVALGPRAEGLIIARCSVCHSADLIVQQRLPRARWEAIVDKMIHWGAELSNDEAQLLTRYLAARYHPGVPDNLPSLEHEVGKAEPLKLDSAAEGPIIGVAARGGGIFEHNCQACHGAGAMGGIGPRLAKSPVLKHDDLFWEIVLRGRGPMPAWGSVLNQQDIADIHAWLLTR